MEAQAPNKPIIDVAAPQKPAPTVPTGDAKPPMPAVPPAAVTPAPKPGATPAGIPVAHQPLTVHKAPADDADTTTPANEPIPSAAEPDPATSEQAPAQHRTPRNPGMALALTCTIVAMLALSGLAFLIYLKSL